MKHGTVVTASDFLEFLAESRVLVCEVWCDLKPTCEHLLGGLIGLHVYFTAILSFK